MARRPEMNIKEGLNRILLTIAMGLAIFVSIFGTILILYTHEDKNIICACTFVLCVIIYVLYHISVFFVDRMIVLISWIIEGFKQPNT